MSKDQEPDDLIGTRVGNYVVEKVIGQGGMGTVYRAVHPKIGRRVAVKVLSGDLPKKGKLAARFEVEAALVAKINHRNVIDIFDYGSLEDGRLHYVMELVEGKNLTDVLEERGRLTPAEALTFLRPICAALQAAHDIGVVHRDLKPDNIMVLDRDPQDLKVLDFGIAKLLETSDTQVLTTTMGTVMGTPMFIAPEQAGGLVDSICPATDLYSLGVMIYKMLSGELPLFHKAVGILMAMHIKDDPVPLREKVPSVPEPIARLVHHCLAKDPRDRPSSAKEIANEFAAILKDEEAAVDHPGSKSEGPDVDRQQDICVTGPTISAGLDGKASGESLSSRSDTTMGNSVGELSPKSVPLWAGSRMAASVSMIVLLGALGFFLWPSGKDEQSIREAAPPAPHAARVVAGKAKEAPAALPRRKVRVEVAGARARCRFRVAAGAVIKRDAPCEFQVEQGAEVWLEVTAEGLQSFVKSFRARADVKLALQADQERKQITRASAATPGVPEEQSPGSAIKPASVIEKKQKKKATVRRRSSIKSRQPRAKTRAGSQTPEKTATTGSPKPEPRTPATKPTPEKKETLGDGLPTTW